MIFVNNYDSAGCHLVEWKKAERQNKDHFMGEFSQAWGTALEIEAVN